MAAKAMFTGTESIIQAFDNMDNPFFSVWINKDILFQNNDGDKDKAKSTLLDMLTAAEQNGNSEILTIKFHPGKEGKYITDKTPVVGTLFVRVVPINGSMAMSGIESGNDRLPYPIYKATMAMQAMAEQLPVTMAGIQDRLTKLEESSISGDDDQDDDQINRILKLANHPVVMALLSKFIPGMGAAAMAVSGITTDQAPPPSQNAISEADYVRLDAALGRLMKHCNLVDDLTLLADLAETSPDMFKLLLSNLRSK